MGGDDVIFSRTFDGRHVGGGRGEGNLVLVILLATLTCFVFLSSSIASSIGSFRAMLFAVV